MELPFIYKKYVVNYFHENRNSIIFYLVIILILYPIESILVSKVKANLFTALDYTQNTKNKTYIENPLFQSILVLCGIYLIVIVFNTLIKYMGTNLYNTYASFIRKEIFEKTIEKYNEQFEDIKIGKYISRLTDLTHELKAVCRHVLNNLLIEFIIITFITFYLLSVNTKISVVIICAYIVFIIFSYFYSSHIIQHASDESTIWLNINENLSDNLSNLMNIYINNENDIEIEKYKNNSDSYSNKTKNVDDSSNFYITFLNIIALITFFIIMFILYEEYMNKTVNKNNFIFIVGLIIIYLTSFYKLNKESAFMFYKIGILNSYNTFVEHISYNSFSNKSSNLNISSKLTNIDFSKNIILSNMSFKYQNSEETDNVTDNNTNTTNSNNYIFNNYTLTIKAREITGILGSSGSGKTTLSKLILKLYKPTNGYILIGDVNIEDIDTTYLRRNIIYVNQKTNLYNKTVIENIMYGNKSIKEADVLRFMKRYTLLDIYSNLDKGIYSNCGVGGASLSLGMQKVIILLRGILKPDYKIIIFDEPLAGIDKKNRVNIINMIKDISKNRTIIIITHDEEILPMCDSISYL
jgi:ATP-binding cassette subfamily B protein